MIRATTAGELLEDAYMVEDACCRKHVYLRLNIDDVIRNSSGWVGDKREVYVVLSGAKMSTYLKIKEGMMVLVHGVLRASSYLGEDGFPRVRIFVWADYVELLDGDESLKEELTDNQIEIMR